MQRNRRSTCLECGFLAFGDSEAPSGDRAMLASRGVNAKMPSLDNLRCYRSLWAEYDMDYFGNPGGPKLEIVAEQRQCEGFRRYQPGFSPAEHLQRLTKEAEQRTQFRYQIAASILTAVLAAILTLLGQWVMKRFGFKP
jgi:hypothetical protein